MNQTDPDSSQEYDPYELFSEELDLDSLGMESPAPEQPEEAPFLSRDEDRLYTDEVIHQNETASRFLFLSVIAAGAISLGIGLWYLLAQKPTPPSPTAPLPVPEQPFQPPQPSFSLPATPPNATVPPGQTLPPSNSGAIPGAQPPADPTLPAQPNAVNGGATVPPPPPPLPPKTSGQ
ncbi:hypothetical protein [Altericista sp. CCNU0014]|uniref:hypothetical protein n=1 Tax=Altericista sp. CCNU0014 TaxID=3082949 RepID=UPI00384B4170